MISFIVTTTTGEAPAEPEQGSSEPIRRLHSAVNWWVEVGGWGAGWVGGWWWAERRCSKAEMTLIMYSDAWISV